MSLADWLSDVDYEWRQRLLPVSLIIETDFSADEVREAQRKFGIEVRDLRNKGVPVSKIIRRYPGLLLMILVGHASLAYDQGAYWESFWEKLGLSRDQEFETAIRHAIVDLLDKFSLARFPDLEQEIGPKYVRILALHAGIPVHCLRDLLVLIDEHIRQGRPATGAALMEWLQEPGKEYRADQLDVPVRNFLENGAEFAADILDRIIEFIEATTADPSLLDAELDASRTGLPGVMLTELIRLLKTNPLQFERKRLRQAGASRPQIRYDVDDDQIVLVLPAPSSGSDLPWRVSLDGDVREVHATRRWGEDVETAEARIAVPAPIREAIIVHPAESSAVTLPLIVQADPLLTFDADGGWVGRRDGLKDCVWAIFPEDHQLIDACTSRPVECQDIGAPRGWHGWRSAFIELDDVGALQLVRDNAPVGTQRWVRKDARPRFERGPVIPGLTTTDGRTVYGARPWVMLPATRTDPAPSWNVRVRRFGESEWLVDERRRSEDVETRVDPFDDADEPQLGFFEILVTGPMGSDARCVVFLAEGIETEFEPSIRVPVGQGLTPCVARVTSEGLSVQPSEPVSFGERDLDVTLDVSGEGVSAQLRLKPPSVEIRTGEVGAPAAWRMSPDVLDPEDFSENRFAAIRAPHVEDVTFAYVSELGDLLQTDPSPRVRQSDVYETRTQQYADTVRRYPSGRLQAIITTEEGVVEVPVLQAQPRLLAAGVELHEGVITFDDVAPVDNLAVHIWSATAPWAPPETLAVVGGQALLPDHLVDAGELRCQLFVDDPWVMLEPPPVPPDTAFRIEQSGWRRDGTAEQVELSRYLAAAQRKPVGVGVIPEIWAALARLHADGQPERFAPLIEILVDNPRRALETLGDSTIPAGDKMAMLIRSELVNHNFSIENTLNPLHTHPWFGCMVELADLPSLYHRREEVREERAETLAYLRDRGGYPLTELLRTGKSRKLADASFDSTIFQMSAVATAEVEEKLREIKQVPRPQLDPTNLRAGVYEGLCRRSEWLRSGWSVNLAQQLELVLTPIRRASQRAHEMIDMRRDLVRGIDWDEHPWILMSVQSLTLAFLARLEAYGRIKGYYLNSGLLRDWASMAQLCPTMVANDLLIAEAVVLYDRRGDLVGDLIGDQQ